jgi:Flp pilus assembly protein TadG
MAMSNHRRNQKGAVIVEHALIFLLFFVVLYAIMEFGRIVYLYNSLAGATREAARYAIVNGSRSASPATNADIRARLLRWGVGFDPTSLTVNTTWTPNNAPGSKVRIESSYNISLMSGLIYNAPLTISSRSEMVISQ